jgi:hypothetical protein
VTDFDGAEDTLIIDGVTLSGLASSAELSSDFTVSEASGDLTLSFAGSNGTAVHTVTLENTTAEDFFL